MGQISLFLGGAASGKSVFAENFVDQTGKPKTYLATAQAFDSEMQVKIGQHQARRDAGWATIEEPLNLGPALSALKPGQICLFDCATLWLSNQILRDADISAEQSALINQIAGCAGDLVIVSNEVGHGVVPDNALARRFRDAQGRLNILLAQQADLVVQITAGLPRVLKGTMP